nr:immunoglobulin light chain junction region [Macaca mulatta]
CLQYNNDPFTF